jgi:hypothetical protein
MMPIFDISWMEIFMLAGTGFLAYVIFPALLVLRELVLHKALEKWVLTNSLDSMIYICETDRWFLDNKFTRSESITYTSNDRKYHIGDEEVNEDDYFEYVRKKSFHFSRFISTDAKIAMRHNLITWFSRYYKLADGGNPIPDLRKHYYSIAGDNKD